MLAASIEATSKKLDEQTEQLPGPETQITPNSRLPWTGLCIYNCLSPPLRNFTTRCGHSQQKKSSGTNISDHLPKRTVYVPFSGPKPQTCPLTPMVDVAPSSPAYLPNNQGSRTTSYIYVAKSQALDLNTPQVQDPVQSSSWELLRTRVQRGQVRTYSTLGLRLFPGRGKPLIDHAGEERWACSPEIHMSSNSPAQAHNACHDRRAESICVMRSDRLPAIPARSVSC